MLKMNQLSLRNNWFMFKTSGKLSIVLEESMKYTSIQQRKICRLEFNIISFKLHQKTIIPNFIFTSQI